MEHGEEPTINWIHVRKDIIQELREEHKRYKFMFRFLFCYLIFDVLIHFNILAYFYTEEEGSV